MREMMFLKSSGLRITRLSIQANDFGRTQEPHEIIFDMRRKMPSDTTKVFGPIE